MKKEKAYEIYTCLKDISEKILKKCKMLPEPILPVNRTRPWQKGGPSGILYHYTGGPNGLKSMKWGNKPSWGNTGSSWHVTVFDRVEDNIIGSLWSDLCPFWLRSLFPVPTIIMASWDRGTWHGNWTNKFLIGVENRNTGHSGYAKLKGGLAALGKNGMIINGKEWEPYTKEQIVSNISIGIIAKGMFDLFIPDNILSHQCVWATKSDTGVLFPLGNIRNAIFGNRKRSWLKGYVSADSLDGVINMKGYSAWISEDEPRCELIPIREYCKDDKSLIHDSHIGKYLGVILRQLKDLGYNIDDDCYKSSSFKKAIRYFQRSTHAYKARKRKGKRPLRVDGICGWKTKKALLSRVKDLGLPTPVTHVG